MGVRLLFFIMLGFVLFSCGKPPPSKLTLSRDLRQQYDYFEFDWQTCQGKSTRCYKLKREDGKFRAYYGLDLGTLILFYEKTKQEHWLQLVSVSGTTLIQGDQKNQLGDQISADYESEKFKVSLTRNFPEKTSTMSMSFPLNPRFDDYSEKRTIASKHGKYRVKINKDASQATLKVANETFQLFFASQNEYCSRGNNDINPVLEPGCERTHSGTIVGPPNFVRLTFVDRNCQTKCWSVEASYTIRGRLFEVMVLRDDVPEKNQVKYYWEF